MFRPNLGLPLAAVLAFASAGHALTADRATKTPVKTRTGAGGVKTPQTNRGVGGAKAPGVKTQPGAAAGVTAAQQAGAAPSQAAAPAAAGARVQGPSAAQAGAATAVGELTSTSQGIRKGADMEAAPGGAEAVVSSLRKLFDADAVSAKAVAGPAASVAGKRATVEDQITADVRNANDPHTSPYSVPGLYLSAIDIAQKAFSPQAAGKIAGTVKADASAKARGFLTKLANQAYRDSAAGQDSRKSLRQSLDRWEKLLGEPGRPLVANAARLQADVDRVHAAAAAAATAKAEAPTISFSLQGGSFVADLPAASVQPVKALDLAIVESEGGLQMGSARSLGQSLALYGLNSSQGFRLVRQAGEATPAATATAGFYAARSAAAGLWRRLVSAVMSLIGRLFPARLDLGEGMILSSNDRGLKRLGILRKTPSPEEAGHLRNRPVSSGEKIVVVDLARINRPYLSARAALAGPARGSAGLDALFNDAKTMADDYRKLSGDGSGALAVESLERRRGRLQESELREGLGFWIEAIYQASLSRLDGQMRSVMARENLERLVLADLRPAAEGGMTRILERGAAAASVDAEFFSRQAPAAPSDEARALERLLSDVRARPKAARGAAAEVPAFKGFRAIGGVLLEGRSFTAERTSLDDGRQALVLREARSGRIEFARLEPARPAR